MWAQSPALHVCWFLGVLCVPCISPKAAGLPLKDSLWVAPTFSTQAELASYESGDSFEIADDSSCI